MKKQLNKQTVLITGAAGRIGFSIAKLLHSKGATLILVDLNSVRLHELCIIENLNNEQTLSIKADISSEAGIRKLFKEIERKEIRIHSAVHCAYPRSLDWGITFEELTETSLTRNLAMQLGGAILFSKESISHFNLHGGGNLVHISSIQGIAAPKFDHYKGTEMSSPIEYSAIKSGIISITMWLAKYFKNKNIRVNCVSPGGVNDGQPEKFVNAYRDSCNNIGLLRAEHIAGSVAFLLSPESEAISGHNIVVDDGWSL